MIEASCHCGTVRIAIEVESPPEQLTSCNCSMCHKYGTLWAYYSPTKVRVTGDTDTYQWGDRTLDTHRCRVCGNVTHWKGLDPNYDRMGVNARLMDRKIVESARIRRLDGADTWKFLDE